jgi:hypothetical protein
MFLGSRVRPVCKTTLPPSMSRLSRQCEILNISQPYRPPRPVTEIALYVCTYHEERKAVARLGTRGSIILKWVLVWVRER